jgi:hypothetical protein
MVDFFSQNAGVHPVLKMLPKFRKWDAEGMLVCFLHALPKPENQKNYSGRYLY